MNDDCRGQNEGHEDTLRKNLRVPSCVFVDHFRYVGGHGDHEDYAE